MNIRILIACGLALIWATPAFATSKENVELLSKHFDSLGTVRYKAFAPLGQDLLGVRFPELGVAEIVVGSKGGPLVTEVNGDLKVGDVKFDHKARLVVARVDDGGKLQTLISEPFMSLGDGADFGLLQHGNHLITYSAEPWTDANGVEHARGDLRVRDLTAAGGVKQLFELRDAIDIGFLVGNPKFQDNLVWQPQLHFLNSGERLPRRFSYSRLALDDVSGEYKLVHHLTALPDANTVLAANLNNRGILYYRAGYLREAARYFSEATTQADTDQSLIHHNTELLGVEMEDLSRQGSKRPGEHFDEALMAYWRGEFDDALLLLGQRGAGVGEFDYALRGLALARARRWAEVDRSTEQLARKALSDSGRGKQFYADYLGEIVEIAFWQGPKFQSVAARYLTALERVDRGHPAYVDGIATLLQRSGKQEQAEQVIDDFIDIAPADVDLLPFHYQLFELYQADGRSTTGLLADAARGPLHNISGYVDMTDYYDLRPALTELEWDGELIDVENAQLDSFSMPDARENGEAPKMPGTGTIITEEGGGTVIDGTE